MLSTGQPREVVRQVSRYALLIAELETEIVTPTLHFRFHYVTISTDGAIELDEGTATSGLKI